ncbi:MAG: DNA-3-methyladenine glycosylase 2 family protein [Cellulomonadaceae bacterium]
MTFDERYRAISAKDARFDGQFITAVRSTGIYCRPSCPARTPQPANVTFYPTSAAAHEAGYRACKRCLPEAVPGTPAWNLRSDTAARATRLIADGMVERSGVPGLAAALGYSSRQLTRILTAELGAGPLALARAHRAQTARTLLTATDLPVADVAFAAGFASIRQFNDTLLEVFRLTPTQLRARRRRGEVSAVPAPGVVAFSLPVREPFDGLGLLAWLAARAVPGVEHASGTRYERSLLLPAGPAWFAVDLGSHPGRVPLTAHLTSLGDLPALIAGVRRLLDLDADPIGIDAALGTRPELANRLQAVPGIRVPGALDGPEMVVRALVGQQISVAAARTHLARLVAMAGEPLPAGLTPSATGPGAGGPGSPGGTVNRLFPDAARIADLGAAALTGPQARMATIRTVTRALADGELRVGVGDDPAVQHAALTSFRGVGPWTAGYVGMRVLSHPDVLLPGDAAIRAGAHRLGLPDDASALTAWAEPLRPWRSYLGMHLWRAAGLRAGHRPKGPS